MGSQHPSTSSGSKSRDTRGQEPSQDDIRDQLKQDADEAASPRKQRETSERVSNDKSGAGTIG